MVEAKYEVSRRGILATESWHQTMQWTLMLCRVVHDSFVAMSAVQAEMELWRRDVEFTDKESASGVGTQAAIEVRLIIQPCSQRASVGWIPPDSHCDRARICQGPSLRNLLSL